MTLACAAHHIDDFVFIEYQRNGPAKVAFAKSICASCNQRTQCLDDELAAMRAGVDTVGVMGGTTAAERRSLLGIINRGPVPLAALDVEAQDASIDHGTTSGYRQHQHLKIPACARCRSAHAYEAKTKRPSRAGLRRKVAA